MHAQAGETALIAAQANDSDRSDIISILNKVKLDEDAYENRIEYEV